MKTKILLIALLSLLLTAPAFAGTKTVTFAWDQDITSGDLDGWILYEYDDAGNPTGETFDIDYVDGMAFMYEAEITVPSGTATKRCYDLTAYDTSGNESEKSNRPCIDIDFQPPPVPGTFSVTIPVVTE